MWEKWANAYTDTMFKAMEKTMEQSSTVRAQMDKAVNFAVSTQFEVALGAIKALEKQVETLSAKVDQLLAEKK